jgi:hypothetical protein
MSRASEPDSICPHFLQVFNWLQSLLSRRSARISQNIGARGIVLSLSINALKAVLRMLWHCAGQKEHGWMSQTSGFLQGLTSHSTEHQALRITVLGMVTEAQATSFGPKEWDHNKALPNSIFSGWSDYLQQEIK